MSETSLPSPYLDPANTPVPSFEDSDQFDASTDPAHAIRGSFTFDIHNGYNLQWASLSEFQAWLEKEEEMKTIQMVRKEIRPNRNTPHLWTEKHIYVCGRGFSGGKKDYKKKHTWTRKVPVKRIGCPCRLTIKTYPGVEQVLGQYSDNHSHETGNQNARFTRLSKSTRQEIERLLRLGVEPKKVLEQIQGHIYNEANLENLRSCDARRSEFVTRADVRRIEKMIEEETIRLASKDGASVLEWVATLQKRGHFVSLKSSSDASPLNSGLEKNSFVLIIQTQYQQECWQKHGHRFAGIDATHNTTHYENMNLFTLLVRDRWGHGMPAAWMISSNGTEETITHFLNAIRTQNPSIKPEYFMSDQDHAEMNSIGRVYPESASLLCWWHVLHAWQQHFSTHNFPEVWDLLKRWIRITDREEFQNTWGKIQTIAPQSVIDYLKEYWVNDTYVRLWSAVYRQDRNIFQLCDTNMLVEAWHHLLKGNFMQGKRNRRLDHLIHILIDQAVPYFIQRHRRQENGFEGPDLEVKKRIEIEARAKSITLQHISQDAHVAEIFLVQSQSDPCVRYRVDLDAYDCECLAFPVICFCKHVCAVQNHFPEFCKPVPTSALAIHCPDSFEPDGHHSVDSDDTDIELLDEATISSSTDTVVITDMIKKLSNLAIHLQTQPPSPLPQLLHDLHDKLDLLTTKLNTPNHASLPIKKKISPNQHSWPETAAVMNVPVKSKRKKHTDPYSGGERPGKKAKRDALTPAQAKSPLSSMITSGIIPDNTPAHCQASSNRGDTASAMVVVHPPITHPFDFSRLPKSTVAAIAPFFPPPPPSFVPPPPPPPPITPSATPIALNPGSIDLRNTFVLHSLKRAHLNQLCSHYKVKANGTNEALIARLQARAGVTP